MSVRGVDHLRDVHVQPGLRWADREPARLVDDVHRLAEALRQAGLDQLLSLGGVEPADVDAGDLHPDRDHVRARGVEVVGVRSARRQCDAAHGEQ